MNFCTFLYFCLLSARGHGSTYPVSYPASYGVDVSYPIHHQLNRNTFEGQRYLEFMDGCYKKYSRRECDSTESARISMNRDQPRHQHNYTELGFKKMEVPPAAWEILSTFWETNKDKMQVENWPPGYTYTNHWDSPTYMVSTEDSNLRGSGESMKRNLWNALRPTLENWVGHKLRESSMYGIRVYKEGAMLATHVDRLPLITSCIINVDQDVDEPWPAEVYDHSGRAYNVTMRPGEMVLYESHTVLHGRPFPMKGRFYANIFVHFIPIDHDEMNEQDEAKANGLFSAADRIRRSVKEASQSHPYTSSTRDRRVSGHEQSNHDLEVEEEDESELVLHHAASRGDVSAVKTILAKDSRLLNKPDRNQWLPLHEAVRGGHYDVVRHLVENGADLEAVTRTGGTPLWLARRTLEAGHAVILYLEELGAPEFGDDL